MALSIVNTSKRALSIPFTIQNSRANIQNQLLNFNTRSIACINTDIKAFSNIHLQNTYIKKNLLSIAPTSSTQIEKRLLSQSSPLNSFKFHKAYSGVPLFAQLPLNENSLFNRVSCDFYTPSIPETSHEDLEINIDILLGNGQDEDTLTAQLSWLDEIDRSFHEGEPNEWYVTLNSYKIKAKNQSELGGFILTTEKNTGFFAKPQSLLTFNAYTKKNCEDDSYSTNCELKTLTGRKERCDLSFYNHQAFKTLGFRLETLFLKNSSNYPKNGHILFYNINVQGEKPTDLSQWQFTSDPDRVCGEETFRMSKFKNKNTHLLMDLKNTT